VTDCGVLGAVLDHADRAPDRPAIKDLDRALTRGELRAAAGRVAAGLLQKGVEPGDRVALLIGNSVDFVVAALGCLWAGVTFVPLAITDPDLRRAQIVADCRPALVITAGSNQTAPSGLPVGTVWTSLSALSVAGGPTPPPVTGPIAYIIYTSGTTGIPKGPRRRQFLRGQDATWCRRVCGGRRFMRPPASAEGTDRRAPPARRPGVGCRCARGQFYRPTVVGKVESVRRQVI
jgi:non-ribosomal peptide synthetase component F